MRVGKIKDFFMVDREQKHLPFLPLALSTKKLGEGLSSSLTQLQRQFSKSYIDQTISSLFQSVLCLKTL
jgi:hypothetical protein